MNIYEELMNNPKYKKLLDNLSEEERKSIEKGIKELMDQFDISLVAFQNALEKS